MISYSIFEFSKTTRLSITHRTRANQLVAGSFGIIMACHCSILLATNPILTPVDERFFLEKGTKESDFLSDLINHNSLAGGGPLVTPNDTNLIFAINIRNEPDVNERQVQEQPQGAVALYMQPLMNFSLPPMSREQIAEIIRKLNVGLSEVTVTTLLNNIPEMPPGDNPTIASMIEQVKASLNVDVNPNQNAIIIALSYTQGAGSPVNPFNSHDMENLAYLLMAYYAAINSSSVSSQRARTFFTSFLLHAAEMAGISRLHWHKDLLLGNGKPIKDKNVLKENVAKSSSVFSGIRSLEAERIKLLEQLKDPLESEQPNVPVEALLRDTAKLLNHNIDSYRIPMYKRQQTSAEHMLELIQEYGGEEPELVVWGNQYLNLIDAISPMLDPFDPEERGVITHIFDMEEYFKKTGKKTTFYNYKSKKRKLLKQIKQAMADELFGQENLDSKSFLKVLVQMKFYICQQLHVAFPDENEFQVIQETITKGFKALQLQSYDLVEALDRSIRSDVAEPADDTMQDQAASGQEDKELGKEEKKRKRKRLKKRLNHLDEFVQWLDYFFGRRLSVPDHCWSSDSDSEDSRCYSNSSGSDKDDVDKPEGVIR
ncbi:hypothetical protein [Endozoicomonas sp. 2B-B]